jgi:hypothetical protein
VAVGIIAFGSLIEDPGSELERVIERVDQIVETPFRLEFARSSARRDGAPTLVPVRTGGAVVPAKVLVLSSEIDPELARDLLYRREVWWRTGPSATYRESGGTWIAETPLPGLETAIYSAWPSNIPHPTAEKLSALAIASARRDAGAERRDGISYLADALDRGLETPLSPDYQAAVLAATGSSSLEDAWRQVRASR